MDSKMWYWLGMPEGTQLLDEYQVYAAPFTRLARFIKRTVLLSQAMLQLVSVSRAVSDELRELAEVLASDPDRGSDVYLNRDGKLGE
jgi:hypothetical protein